MRILSTEFNLKHRALEIYLSGCTRRCPGCHNPESWDFNQGIPFMEARPGLVQKLNNPLVKAVWVLGGEPLDQNHSELWRLLFLPQLQQELWLFTSYEPAEIPYSLAQFCTYIKTGSYRADLVTDNNIQHGLKLASSNQNIMEVSHAERHWYRPAVS